MGPRSAVERTARAKLESVLLSSCYSTAVGWIISLDSQLCDGVEEVHHIKAQLQEMPAFANMSRQYIGITNLLYIRGMHVAYACCHSASDLCIVVTAQWKTSLPHVYLN